MNLEEITPILFWIEQLWMGLLNSKLSPSNLKNQGSPGIEKIVDLKHPNLQSVCGQNHLI